jgi:hypothetical protein
MSLLELGEAFLWLCFCCVLTAIGVLVACIGMALNYFRGTRAGRTPLVCAIVAAGLALLLWLIFALADFSTAIFFAAGMSLAAFMAFASYWSRFDRS